MVRVLKRQALRREGIEQVLVTTYDPMVRVLKLLFIPPYYSRYHDHVTTYDPMVRVLKQLSIAGPSIAYLPLQPTTRW